MYNISEPVFPERVLSTNAKTMLLSYGKLKNEILQRGTKSEKPVSLSVIEFMNVIKFQNDIRVCCREKLDYYAKTTSFRSIIKQKQKSFFYKILRDDINN